MERRPRILVLSQIFWLALGVRRGRVTQVLCLVTLVRRFGYSGARFGLSNLAVRE
jgi:hypothetical protein